MLPPPKSSSVKWAKHRCPVCDAEKVADNRENKRHPRGPDFKCLACGHAEWITETRP